MIEPREHESVMSEIRSAKWLVWHGEGGKAVARIKALDDVPLAKAGYEFSTLWWNLRCLPRFCTLSATPDDVPKFHTVSGPDCRSHTSAKLSQIYLVLRQTRAKRRSSSSRSARRRAGADKYGL
jgi:hypothetical protein